MSAEPNDIGPDISTPLIPEVPANSRGYRHAWGASVAWDALGEML